MPLRILLTVRCDTFQSASDRRPISPASPEDMQMRHHESPGLISECARTVALMAALLLSSGVTAQAAFAQDTSAPPSSESTMDSTHAYGAPSSVWNAQRIRRVIDEGTHLVLTDGTIWEIYLPDRPSVNTWKQGDLLVVREAAIMQGEFDYTLRDGRTRKPVHARLVGDLSSRS